MTQIAGTTFVVLRTSIVSIYVLVLYFYIFDGFDILSTEVKVRSIWKIRQIGTVATEGNWPLPDTSGLSAAELPT